VPLLKGVRSEGMPLQRENKKKRAINNINIKILFKIA